MLAACADPAAGPPAAALAPAPTAAREPGPVAASADLTALAAAHNAAPGDAAAALAYARGLRRTGARREALAVLDKAAAKGGDRRLQLERGLLALELGETARAERALGLARDPKRPDWRLHMALGTALASRGRQQEAQQEFAKALALAPDHPSILNNLALSYALDGKVAEAESLLRKAQRAPQRAPQVDQNLALVVGLAGRRQEAQALAAASLPPAEARENMAYLERLAEARASTGRRESAGLPQPTYRVGGP